MNVHFEHVCICQQRENVNYTPHMLGFLCTLRLNYADRYTAQWKSSFNLAGHQVHFFYSWLAGSECPVFLLYPSRFEKNLHLAHYSSGFPRCLGPTYSLQCWQMGMKQSEIPLGMKWWHNFQAQMDLQIVAYKGTAFLSMYILHEWFFCWRAWNIHRDKVMCINISFMYG